MTTKQKPKKKNKVIPFILGGLILIGGIFGFKEYLYRIKHVDTDNAQIDGDISPVISRVGGYIKDINFEENTKVNEGDILVTLDDDDYKIKLKQAMAEQMGANAGVGVSEAQIAVMLANTEVAKANIEAARIKLNLAQKDYNRYANLIKDDAVTQQAFDQVKAQKEGAQAAYDTALNQYNATLKQAAASRSQLLVSNNNVYRRQSEVDFAKLQLSYTQIKAPVTGIASKKNIQKGQFVQAGQPLFSIVNNNSLYVIANFKETQLEKIKNGSLVKIGVDAYPKEEINGEVYNFSPITGAKNSLLPPDNATGNFVKVIQRVPVKIKIKNADKQLLEKLRPGMSVRVSIAV